MPSSGLDPKLFIDATDDSAEEELFQRIVSHLPSLVWLSDWRQIGFFVEKETVITCNPCNKAHCNIDLLPQITRGTSFDWVNNQISPIENLSFLIKEYDQQYDIVLLKPTIIQNNQMTLTISPDAISLCKEKVFLFTLDEELEEPKLYSATINQVASTHIFNKQRILQISTDSAKEIDEDVSIGTPILYEKDGNFSVVGILNKSRAAKCDCLAKPSNALVECLLGATEDSTELFSSECILEQALVQVFAQSEIAYREASSLGAFATKETVEKELKKNTEQRNFALAKWYAENNRCIRFIYKKDTSSGAKHMIGLTCVLPLTREEYFMYKEGKIKEYCLSAINDTNVTDKTGYFCFQSFVYCGKMRGENVSKILKKAIIEHIMDLAVDLSKIYCIAEIGTMAGDNIANKFKGCVEVGLSLDRRPLREWFFSAEEISDLV